MKRSLLKIEKLINSNSKDKDILELKSLYESYTTSDSLDMETKNLYMKYMNDLYKDIIYKREINKNIIMCFISMLVVLTICIFNIIMFNTKTKAIEENVIKANSNTSLIVDYNNLDDFIMLVLDDSDYLNVEPITIKLKSISDASYEYRLRYNIYLDIDASPNQVDINNINYAITNGNTIINNLGEQEINDNRILIYSSTISKNKIEDIDLRLWLTKLDINKYNLKFKIYVESYLV